MDCDKKLYAIREVSEITGVKPVTLRAWQRRYNLIKPQRTEKGHRLYREEDITRIEEIQSWLSKGVSIGKVKALLEGNLLPEEAQSTGVEKLEDVEVMLEALAMLRKAKAESIINTVLKEYPLEVVEQQFITPVKNAISMVKRNQKILQESLFMSLLIPRLESIIESENKAARAGKCLLISYANNRDISSRLWAAQFSAKGWNVAIMDGIEDISGLNDLELSDAYDSIAVYSPKPVTEVQKSAIEQLRASYTGNVILSDVLELTRSS
ncbi:MerR family transcriptional regulator [Vibrio japonicus]|uniref:MerR family transcriptional regulator n=1 Tax=Vibrio japonicus TaxID=1824638 RepID=A0ABY5LQA0_9VIBR|nr:MerR family transcriptional regulator [Vibrio japonicus]UUM33105.1 MerR family transcriptional regulator [Vibrio japonicus]